MKAMRAELGKRTAQALSGESDLAARLESVRRENERLKYQLLESQEEVQCSLPCWVLQGLMITVQVQRLKKKCESKYDPKGINTEDEAKSQSRCAAILELASRKMLILVDVQDYI